MKIKLYIYISLLCFVFLMFAQNKGYSAKQEVILTLHGSNTIGARLIPDISIEFLKKLGADRVDKIVHIKNTEMDIVGHFPQHKTRVIRIKAHGSSTGFKGLMRQSCDIAMASRKVKKKEIQKLSSIGNMTSNSCENVLGLDGIAIIINKNKYKEIKEMELEDVAKIFSGELNNWDHLGESYGRINIYARDDQSGTHDTFKNIVLQKRYKLSSEARRFDSHRDLSNAIANDINGIGYCGLSYVNPNKCLKISNGGPAIFPSYLTIGVEDYPISRRLHLYTPASPKNKYTRQFVAFALSREGQIFVEKNEFVSLTIKAVDYNVDYIKYQNHDVISRYLNVIKNAKRLSVNFRFEQNQYQLDTRSLKDIQRLVEYVSDNKNQISKLILAGFADSMGKYWTNYQLSCNRAIAVSKHLCNTGVDIQEIFCVSEEMPVATNDNGAGRAKNRRVEVWVE